MPSLDRPRRLGRNRFATWLWLTLTAASCTPSAGPTRPSTPPRAAVPPSASASNSQQQLTKTEKAEPEATTPAALPPPADEGAFKPWLRTKGNLTFGEVKEGVAVLVNDRVSQYTVASGYILDAVGLREEPRLLNGLSLCNEEDSGNTCRSSALRGAVLQGLVKLRGRWPNAATAEVYRDFSGSCSECTDYYVWNGERFVLNKHKKVDPSWWNKANMDPYPSSVSFRNGTTLWEKFEPPSGGYVEGRSTFYTDSLGHARSMRKRAPALPSCQGKTRLVGRFSGMALDDGSLIGLGADCKTGVISSEVWSRGALSSRVEELPRRPRGLPATLYEIPFEFGILAPDDVVIAFNTTSETDERTYVASFDGKQWLDLSPSTSGKPSVILRPADGSIWLKLDDELWRHPGIHQPTSAWKHETGTRELPFARTIKLDRKGGVWSYGQDSVYEYRQDKFVEHPLPPCGELHGGSRATINDLAFTNAGEAVVIATCGEGEDRVDLLFLERVPLTLLEG